MTKRKIIIIGGGIAGLSAGCYARMNGYEAVIYERHAVPGGLCTAWKRKGYTIDGCIHWLVGTKPGGTFRNYWDELGALDGVSVVDFETLNSFETVEDGKRRTFTIYSDADRLNAHMKEISPADAPLIDELTGIIKRFGDLDMDIGKPRELMGFRDFMAMMRKMGPYMKDFSKYSKLSIGDFAARFSSPVLREGLRAVFNEPRMAFMALVFTLAWKNAGNAGFPLGGSLEFARRIERRFLGLGGTVHYGGAVSRIVVEKGRATGIELSDGTRDSADIVISAADGYATIYGMLGGKYRNRKIDRHYAALPLFEPLFSLALGIRRDLSKEPRMAVRALDRPMTIEGKTQDKIGFNNYSFDPSLAPAGCSLIEIMYTSDYDRWKRLSSDRAAYEAEKDAVTRELVAGLEEVYPGIGKDIEMMDAATPVTWERYTGNRRGTFEGWLLTKDTLTLAMKKNLPGLKNFYMAGQWVQPGGGIPTAMKSGRDVIEIICAREGKTFAAT
jgi:phytoene dehydrogenase-like protein